MTAEEFMSLKTGDLVRHVNDHRAYIVTANYGGRATAVRVADLTNPDEWLLAGKANYEERPPERK